MLAGINATNIGELICVEIKNNKINEIITTINAIIIKIYVLKTTLYAMITLI